MRWTTDKEAGAYLAAIIDGEGHVNTGYKNKKISVFNKNLNLLLACGEACEKLGITYNLRPCRAGKCEGHVLHIWSELNFQIVLKKVPLQHDEKLEKLQYLVGSYTRKMKQPTTKVVLCP